jgi:hypothetical protein
MYIELMVAIKSTYFCTPYRSSIDMLMAVARQYDFALKVATQIDWQYPTDLAQGIRSYHDFFVIIKRTPGVIAIPNIAAGKFYL